MKKIIATEYLPGQDLVITRLTGLLNFEDIQNWKLSLEEALIQVPDNSSFRILVNQHGFKAENFEVHKVYRNIMPLFLASYGYRIGYLDMFPEATVELKNTRGIKCIAIAIVHHDESKMKDYQQKFSSEKEQYFTAPDQAEYWIRHI
jgi:hypothetical protein